MEETQPMYKEEIKIKGNIEFAFFSSVKDEKQDTR
jgi:hypothetical protein